MAEPTLEQLLLDCENPPPGTPAGRCLSILADWVADNPAQAGAALSEVLRRLPDLMAPVAAESLTVTANAQRHYLPSKTITTGVHLDIHWRGRFVASALIDLG